MNSKSEGALIIRPEKNERHSKEMHFRINMCLLCVNFVFLKHFTFIIHFIFVDMKFK